jgi:L-lactate dehydrogenase complex protein LldE
MRRSLFIACCNNALESETGRAEVQLQEQRGVPLGFRSQQTCCGQMHTGFGWEVLAQIEHYVYLYQNAELVLIPSSSYVKMIRDQYSILIEVF